MLFATVVLLVATLTMQCIQKVTLSIVLSDSMETTIDECVCVYLLVKSVFQDLVYYPLLIYSTLFS